MTRLESERLLLRPPEIADIPALVPLIDDFDVAKNLSRAPHPYSETDARAYLEHAAETRAAGTDFSFAILRKVDRAYLGNCGVHKREAGFEFGYWLGKPFWGQGYATEAARRLVEFAFDDLKVQSLIAGWFHDNPASGRVLAKLGCVPDGTGQRDCLARGHAVYCHNVKLARESFERSKIGTVGR
jgi:ribosomal-protein-alanine N-acetyltransferase